MSWYAKLGKWLTAMMFGYEAASFRPTTTEVHVVTVTPRPIDIPHPKYDASELIFYALMSLMAILAIAVIVLFMRKSKSTKVTNHSNSRVNV